MEGATKVKTSEFANYIIENMDGACDRRGLKSYRPRRGHKCSEGISFVTLVSLVVNRC